MGEVLYTLFIWPIRFVLEFLFVLFNRIFDAPGPSIIFLSVVVNTLSLPMYIIADGWQKEERELQRRMKKKLGDIRAVFKGDERQMIINTYYRQMGYSPFFVVKASVGLLLQIPFFIAAYQFLSHTNMLSGASFLFLDNLSRNDALIRLPVFGSVNLLPFVMTVLNLASSFIYAKDLGRREIIQLFAMALVFLVLLYNSPSGLVLYWTVNNLYSLAKNAASYLKKPALALQTAISFFSLVFIVLIWTGKANVERYGLLFSGLALGMIAAPFIWKALVAFLNNPGSPAGPRRGKETAGLDTMPGLYFSAMFFLFLLLGVLSPAQVLSASLADFERPWVFLGRTLLQGTAFLVLIPLFVRALAPGELRRPLAFLYGTLSSICGFCYFFLAKSYGRMDRNFKLDDTERLLHAFPPWVSAAVIAGALVFTACFIFLRKEKILQGIFGAACAAALVLGMVNLVSIGRQDAALSTLTALEGASDSQTVFPLSRTGTNTFVVFFDRAQGTAMTAALEKWPFLTEELEGFIFYPNTLSFGGCTVTGVPAMLGGYDYTPLAINQRKEELLVDKVNEALTLLPRLFGEAGCRVTITDPVIANMQSVPDISIFRGIKNVSARNLSGALAGRFREEFPAEDEKPIDSFDFDILFRYGIFRAAPPALRYGIHYKGQWWREGAYNSYGRAAAEFSSLYYLADLCGIDEGSGTLNIFMNAVTHESGAYNSRFFPQPEPVEFSGEETGQYGSEENAEYMYTLMAAMTQFIKWLDFLRGEGIYDNTRIIVVSDHGGSYHNPSVGFGEMESHNPLLLVKEAGSRGGLSVSPELMTHADTPALAAKTLAEAAGGAEETGTTNGAAAAAGKREAAVLAQRGEAAKKQSLWAVSETSSQPLRHGPYGFSLDGVRELKGREVLERESWGEWKAY
ncbi:MAG: YidC/Oxa1 family membrane protein insertase [Spirochaetaceae bacterium]|jgi:YidC/Oxa1 family membrane protein insertase|nr:YidC/Oxa1 family membrane protein insertase [Spirochaetaceae bacterium]